MKITRAALAVFMGMTCTTVFAAGPADLTVYGEISSETGFRFPDGTLQTTAAGGALYHTIVVAKSGGDFTSIQAAIDSITDAQVAAPYLVSVQPGTYQENVVLKPFVHLRGAGRDDTRIAVVTASSAGRVVEMTEDTSVSSLSIVCAAALGSTCTGLFAGPMPATQYIDYPQVKNVSIDVKALSSTGTAIGVQAAGNSTTFDVATLILQDVSIWAHEGIRNIGVESFYGRIIIEDSDIESTSPASGTHDNRAVNTDWSYLTVRGSRLSVKGGNPCSAVQSVANANVGSSPIAITHSTIEASSTADNARCYGVNMIEGTDVDLRWSSIEIEDAAYQYGIVTTNDPDFANVSTNLLVTHSKIRAEDYTAFTSLNGVDARFLYSHFDGGIVLAGSGTTVCRYSTDENLDTFDIGCP